jgi:hypothetical protein
MEEAASKKFVYAGRVRMKKPCFLYFLTLASVITISHSTFADDLIAKAEIGKDTNLHIFTDSGKEIIIPKKSLKPSNEELQQVSFEQIKLSADRLSIGWLATYQHCCTSYPIPLRLNVYSNQKEYSFTGLELPIWQWNFSTDGKLVAFHQEAVHGGTNSHFELREIKTNKVIESFDPEVDQDTQPINNQQVPAWTKQLIEK